MEEKSLKESIEELTKLVKENNEKVKEKKWKFPFGTKPGKSQRKKNYVCTLVINENGHYEFKKYQIKDQTFLHDTIPRLASSGYVMFNKKGIPLVILPNWSVKPFSPMENYQESLIDGSNTTGYRLLMARMQSEKVDEKKKIAGWVKWVIGFIIVGGIIFALVSGGGGKAPTPA